MKKGSCCGASLAGVAAVAGEAGIMDGFGNFCCGCAGRR